MKNHLGFVILEEIPSQQGMIIGNRAAKLALYENAELGRVTKHGFSHLCFHISNFENALSLCEELALPILYEGIVEWPKSKSLHVEDSNGYEVEFTNTWGGDLAQRNYLERRHDGSIYFEHLIREATLTNATNLAKLADL